eukprot:Gb_03152 [translate_table: standard]
MGVTPDATPGRGPPPLIPSTSPFPPQRRAFVHRRHESFADSLVRSGSASQVSVMEEGSKPPGKRLSDGHLASRKAEEAVSRRFQAAGWVKSMVGPVDMPYEPSEEEFRLCLRNGLILCSLINKVQPGAVPKVVESHVPSLPPEEQPLSAYQYFENVRNFLVAVEDMKLPTFEASDLEQGSLQVGSTTKIVDCILGLKSYHEWKQCGGNGSWKYTGPLRSPMVSRNMGSFHQHSSPSVPSKALDTLPNSSASSIKKNCRHLDLSHYENPIINGIEKTEECNTNVGQTRRVDSEQILNGALQPKDLTGALIKQLGAEITNSKENVDQNLLGALRSASLNCSTQSIMALIFATLGDKQKDKVPLMRMHTCQRNLPIRSGLAHSAKGTINPNRFLTIA